MNNMKQIRHVIKDEEKEILSNFFLQEGNNSRQNYLKWLDSFFASYGIVKAEDSKRSVYSANYSIDMIWDASANTSLIQHLSKNRKYSHSNSLFKNFKKFHPNLNHVDNNGNNILHDAAQHNYSLLNQILKEEKVDKTLINNDGKTYHMLMIDSFNAKDLLPNPKLHHVRDMSNRVSLIVLVLTNLHDFMENRMQDVVQAEKLHDFISKNEQIAPAMDNMWKLEVPNIRAEAYKECIQEVADFKNQLMFLKLSDKLEEKRATPKMKI
jgi:hypothetical protein